MGRSWRDEQGCPWQERSSLSPNGRLGPGWGKPFELDLIYVVAGAVPPWSNRSAGHYEEETMQRILVPVDGSSRAEAAVKEGIRLAKAGAAREIHLLNVQANIFSEPSMIYLEPARMDTYYYEQSDNPKFRG